MKHFLHLIIVAGNTKPIQVSIVYMYIQFTVIVRMRKWRLQLMPLHNLDNADSDEEELLNDDQAPTFQVWFDQLKINS